jgi:hypothetical protein
MIVLKINVTVLQGGVKLSKINVIFLLDKMSVQKLFFSSLIQVEF